MVRKLNDGDFGSLLNQYLQQAPPEHDPWPRAHSLAQRHQAQGYLTRAALSQLPATADGVFSTTKLARRYEEPLAISPCPVTNRPDPAMAKPAGSTLTVENIERAVFTNPGLNAHDLRRLRHDYALAHHPDRVPPCERENASRRMAIVNALIDRALRHARE